MGRLRRQAARGTGAFTYADLVLPHYRAPGRHMYVDAAVASPETVAALSGMPSSRDRGGVAAEARVRKKHSKYKAAVDAMGGLFRATVMERYGACSDDLCGFVKSLCGDGECDVDSDDWSFTARTRVDFHMQRVVFAGVLADAAMVDAALDMDLSSVHSAAVVGGVGAAARRARGGGG